MMYTHMSSYIYIYHISDIHLWYKYMNLPPKSMVQWKMDEHGIYLHEDVSFTAKRNRFPFQNEPRGRDRVKAGEPTPTILNHSD